MHQSAATHGKTAAGKIDLLSSGIHGGVAHSFHHRFEIQVILFKRAGVYGDLILLLKSPDTCDFRYAWCRLKDISQIPVLKRSQIGERSFTRVINQSVLENPPNAGGVRPHFYARFGRQSRRDPCKEFGHPASCPVEIRSILEEYVNERESCIRKATHGGDLRCA